MPTFSIQDLTPLVKVTVESHKYEKQSCRYFLFSIMRTDVVVSKIKILGSGSENTL